MAEQQGTDMTLPTIAGKVVPHAKYRRHQEMRKKVSESLLETNRRKRQDRIFAAHKGEAPDGLDWWHHYALWLVLELDDVRAQAGFEETTQTQLAERFGVSSAHLTQLKRDPAFQALMSFHETSRRANALRGARRAMETVAQKTDHTGTPDRKLLFQMEGLLDGDGTQVTVNVGAEEQTAPGTVDELREALVASLRDRHPQKSEQDLRDLADTLEDVVPLNELYRGEGRIRVADLVGEEEMEDAVVLSEDDDG